MQLSGQVAGQVAGCCLSCRGGRSAGWGRAATIEGAQNGSSSVGCSRESVHPSSIACTYFRPSVNLIGST